MTDYSPRPFTPSRAVLDAILVDQRRKEQIASASESTALQDDARRHRKVIAMIEEVKATVFPERPRWRA